jgi:DNA-binding response OmpR family regulator
MQKRVLLCDDESHILHAAEFKLRRANFEVRSSSDGEGAWEVLQDWLPDVLITDCQMPRLDGIGLVRRCRQHETTRELPILMLTAKGFELSPELLYDELKVLGVMSKPFSPRELLRCVEQIIETGSCTTPQAFA